MAVVERIQAWVVSLPLPRPVEFAGMRFNERDYTVVQVTSSEGATGLAFGLARGAPIATTVARLAPLVIGTDSDLVEATWERMYTASITYGQRGIALRAISLLDIALWDLRGRIWNAPVYRLLGGVRDEVPVAAVGGYFRERRSRDDIASEMKSYVHKGFRLIKIVGGGWSPTEEEKWVADVRSAVGEDVDLAVDAHWTWNDVESARRTVERWDAYQLRWVEDPMWPEALGAAAELRRHVRTPLAIGDELSGRWAFQELALRQAADIWRVDAMAVGGLTEFRRISALASTWGVPIATHIYPEMHAHCAAACSSVMAIEWTDPDQDIDLSYQFIAEPARPANGMLKLPSTPGFGIELDWDFITGHATEHYVC